jgi:hypothetical protein
MPVAWTVVRATQPGAWRPHWERLLGRLQGSVPAGWLVVELADRGLYAPWLFAAITRRGWHPGLRSNGGARGSGLYRLPTGGGWRPLAGLLSAPGGAWCGAVYCVRERTLRCTLLARWEVGHTAGWLVVTDLPATEAEIAWYGLRVGIEAGVKELKRDGWQWQHTPMTDPARAARVWLVLAVATLWAVSVGGAADASRPASRLEALPPSHGARQRTSGHPVPRLLSCFRRGLLLLVIGTAAGGSLPPARFLPEPWPTAFDQKTYP